MNIAKLTRCLLDPTYRRVMLRRMVAAAVEHESVLFGLGACRLVVDVGANRGQFALVSRRCYPDAMIVSFEPLPVPAAIYRKIFEGDRGAILHQVAIGAECGYRSIHVSARDDSSSLLPITYTQETLFPGTAEIAIETVYVDVLADYLDPEMRAKPALLKIDVQGLELEVLRGCVDVLDWFDYVYVECSFKELYEGQSFAHEVVEWLHDRGYLLSGMYNPSYDAAGIAIQSDFLFARATKAGAQGICSPAVASEMARCSPGT